MKITSAQEPQWKTFADTMRDNGDTMGRLYRERMAKHDVSALDDMKQYAELSRANADGAKKLADAFAPLYEGFPADQKALADTTFRSWLHHGGEHRGKGKTKGTDGKAAAAPAASAPRSPDARPAGAVPPVRAERRRARRPARHTARRIRDKLPAFTAFPPFPVMLELKHLDLRTDPQARRVVKDETVAVAFAQADGELRASKARTAMRRATR